MVYYVYATYKLKKLIERMKPRKGLFYLFTFK